MRVLPLAAAGVILLAAARADAHGPHKKPPPPPPPAPAAEEAAPAPPPAPASAPGDTYAIAAIDIAGDADPGLKSAIAAALARGLDDAGAPHVTADVVAAALRARSELVGCTSTTCLAKLGSIVGASRFVTARVETAGAAYNVELTVLTVDGPVARTSAKCEVCTMSDLGDLLAKKTQTLITQPGAQPVAITLATTPAGGDVAVSPGENAGPLRPLGKAPAQISLAPGTYLVEVRLAGYSVLRKTITVSDTGEPQSFELALAPADAGGPEGAAPRFAIWKWATGGAAAVALVSGLVVLSYDGGQACGTPPCPQVYETTGRGLALVGVGVLAGAAAGWMFWSDHERSARAVVAPTQGGAAASVRVDF
jgi:hypothetical protein